MAAAYATPALLAHVHLVAPRLRAADAAEVAAEGADRPACVLRRLLRVSSFARTVFIGGEAAAMFGVQINKHGIAVPWLLTTDTVDRHPRAFWQASKYVVWQLRRQYPLLSQCIDARYEKALRWARWLGFKLEEETHPCGDKGMPFYRATLSREA